MYLTPNRWVGGRNLHMFFMRTDLKARYSVNKLFSPWFFFLSLALTVGVSKAFTAKVKNTFNN